MKAWEGRIRSGLRSAAILLVSLAIGACSGSGDVGGVVLIESTPESGALVKVGAHVIGETPCRVEGYPPGTTGIVAYLEGYKRYANIVTIPESGESKLTIELEPLEGYLSLTSEPVGADVYLDATDLLGRTPLRRASVPIGDHTYSIVLENHEAVEVDLYIDDGLLYEYHHLLTPLDGRLNIVSRPTGARVWINDRPVDVKTPAQIPLPPGDYTVGVHRDGFIQTHAAARIGPNEEVHVELTMMEGDVPPGMVLVPAGEFVYGKNSEAPDERPERTLFVDAFYIDKMEVTNLAFQEVFPDHEFMPNEDLLPVTGVTWRQAEEYAKAIGKRLPREIEWEKAARGPKALEYPWGDRFEADRLRFAESPGRGKPDRVGTYRAGASPYGCLDMAGNVYEWTADWYEPYPGNKSIQATYGQLYRVLRGGSFLSSAYDVRAPRRHYDKPGNGRNDYGFRCAMDVHE